MKMSQQAGSRTAMATVVLLSVAVGIADAHPAPGIVIDSDGRAIVADFTRNRILRVSMDGRVETIAEDRDGKLLSVPHALFLDSAGRLITASDTGGRVLRIDAGSGRIELIHPAGWLPDSRAWAQAAAPLRSTPPATCSA
jgi:sugar lactone lactonase YvrE